jgi:hypothetical protein
MPRHIDFLGQLGLTPAESFAVSSKLERVHTSIYAVQIFYFCLLSLFDKKGRDLPHICGDPSHDKISFAEPDFSPASCLTTCGRYIEQSTQTLSSDESLPTLGATHGP